MSEKKSLKVVFLMAVLFILSLFLPKPTNAAVNYDFDQSKSEIVCFFTSEDSVVCMSVDKYNELLDAIRVQQGEQEKEGIDPELDGG